MHHGPRSRANKTASTPARGGSSGLTALATLINDALAAMGTQPALAADGYGLSGPRPGDRTLSIPTGTAPPLDRSKLRARSSRALAPVDEPPDLDDGSYQDHGRDQDDRNSARHAADVDAEHAQMWSLVHLAQQGDGEAFGLLYDRYVDSVFRFIYYRVNDRALAEDFTSETFMRALRRISSISYQGRDIGAWFVTIARNIVLDHVKSARNRLEITTSDTLEGPDTTESTESAVLTSLDSQRLMAAVGELGDEQRDCVTLRFIQGLSVHETAAVMGKNDGAIKALQHRAVRKLAVIIGDTI